MEFKNKLKEAVDETNKVMNKISNDIKEIENILKKSTFETFEFESVEGHFKLYWDEKKRELGVKDLSENTFTRLIETKAYIRKILHKHLDKFIDKLINFQKGEDSE